MIEELTEEQLLAELQKRRTKRWKEVVDAADKTWKGLTREIVDFLVPEHTKHCINCNRCILEDVVIYDSVPHLKELNILIHISEVPELKDFK